MEKIISLFKRDYEGSRLIYDEIVPGAEWVIAGEGIATVKYDGTACMIRDGKLYKRYDAKKGKIPPVGFEPTQDIDPITGHWPGWLPVGDGPEDKWHREAFRRRDNWGDGTYELVGPKVQGNPYSLGIHDLWRHGTGVYTDGINAPPRDFDGLRNWFASQGYAKYPHGAVFPVEGIVWHHPDGRMVKIKRRDFGMPWPVKDR